MKILRKTLKYISIAIGSFIAFVGLYLLSAYILSHISTSREATNPDLSIYIKTNGVHTDLVMPVRTAQIDWSRELPFSNTAGKDTTAQYIAMGWGDKGFYLETPTWADLKFSTAFKAAFALSTAAIHTTYYKTLQEGADCKKIEISSTQYDRLIQYIHKSFRTDAAGHMIHIVTNANYGADDAFYEAGGSYSLFHTCNTWANSGLKSCGQKACLWTPFDKGIFYQYEKH
ncbi:TIGR02117 family protein [Chitinophagaceae bacterium MMS25-I14]